ncbi:MAG: DUF2236 domain-containing protein [Myxococcota bacterium]|nr:DUF2236 domain-containing protein [Myxococcota bacterium]
MPPPARSSDASALEYPERYSNRVEVLRIYPELEDPYGRALLRGDPLADAVARWLATAGAPGRALFEKALARGIGAVDEPPEPLARFFAAIDRVPDWVDFARIDRGARAYQRVGPATLFILSAWSLMNGYHSAAAVKPLAFTRQLESMAPRRLAETGRFITDVTQVGALQRHARGFEIAARVRLMHAHVRVGLERSPAWSTRAWGVPINQGDMLGTVLEFSLLWLRGAEMLGFHLEPQEREDVLHLWRYAGWLSGVDDELLSWIDTVDRGARTAEMMHLAQPGPDEDSLALAAALREVPIRLARTPFESLSARWIVRYHDGLTRAFNGDRIADDLRIPNAHWKHSIVPTRVIVGALERIRRAVPGATWLVTEVGNRHVRAHIEHILDRREPTYAPAARLDESRGGRTSASRRTVSAA